MLAVVIARQQRHPGAPTDRLYQYDRIGIVKRDVRRTACFSNRTEERVGDHALFFRTRQRSLPAAAMDPHVEAFARKPRHPCERRFSSLRFKLGRA